MKFLNLTKICQKRLKILLEGESLFNDVVSIVLFTMFVELLMENSQDVSILVFQNCY
ncbi:cation:proton antiporter [Francisella tularensis]|nr:cation:proton antiporter [Francisella tularensis]